MAGGPILPSSIYLGGASGNLSPTFYSPGGGSPTGTFGNAQGVIEGVGVVGSLASLVLAPLQFNLPEVIPSGAMKLRCLAWANASSGNAKINVNDGQTAAGGVISNTTLTADTGFTVTGWPGVDQIVENKVALTTTATPNSILTVMVGFDGSASQWTLTATSVWQFSLVWE